DGGQVGAVPGGQDVATCFTDLLVARELQDDLVDAEVIRALAQEGQDFFLAAGQGRNALVHVAKKLSGECPAIRLGVHLVSSRPYSSAAPRFTVRCLLNPGLSVFRRSVRWIQFSRRAAHRRSGCVRPAAVRSDRSRFPSPGGTTWLCAPCGPASVVAPTRWWFAAACRRASTPECGLLSRRATARGRSSTAT